METSEQLAILILRYIEDNYSGKVSPFCRDADVSRSYIRDLTDMKRIKDGRGIEPTIGTLQKLAKGMHIPLDQLLSKAGYFEGEKRDYWKMKELAERLPDELLELGGDDAFIQLAKKMRKHDIPAEDLLSLLRLLNR